MTKLSHPSAGGAYVVDKDGKLKRDDAGSAEDKAPRHDTKKPAKEKN